MKQLVDVREGLRAFPPFPVVLVTMPGRPPNILTAAMCHVFSFDPPLVGVGVAPKRYSYERMKEHKDFVVNIPTKDLLEQTLFCGTRSGREVDKFEATRLTPIPAKEVEAPLIGECPVNLECRTTKIVETGDHTWFIGQVLQVHKDVNYSREVALCYWGREFRLPGTLLRHR